MACLPAADDLFGPAVHGCRHVFDFTLLFEQSIFQIAPSALLLLCLPLRASQLRKQSAKTSRTSIRVWKQASIAFYAATQLALLIVWSATPTYRTRASIPAALLSFLASIALLVLSSVEHTRSVRPSTLINVYLLFSLLLDVPQTRTLWLRESLPRSVAGIFTAGLAAKTCTLWLEARSKRRSLFPPYNVYAPEALVSLYDRTVLWWLNPLFVQGYKSIISMDTLYKIDSDLSSESVEDRFQALWAKRSQRNKWPLLRTTVASVKGTILAAIVPRVCLSALKLSQPLLINRLTTWLSSTGNADRLDTGRGLIVATVCIYLGIAIMTAITKRLLDRLITQVRGVMVSAIHLQSLRVSVDQLSDSAALTLVSTDVTRICMSLRDIDNLFVAPLEVAAALFLLERQIGVSCVAPVVFVVAVAGVSFLNSSRAIPLQQKWLAAVRERVAFTAAVLDFPRGFKMLGLTNVLTDSIQALRVKELVDYADYRKFVTHRNTFGALPAAFAPALTLMMFTLINGGSALTPAVAFTALSLVALLTAPIENLIALVPMIVAELASVDRIEAFLLLETIDGERRVGREDTEDLQMGDIELTARPGTPTSLRLESASVRLGKEHKLVLNDVTLDLLHGSITLVVGPVGSGKSTLLQAIVGAARLSDGQRQCSDGAEFAYCAQNPWLPNGTVQELVLAHSPLESTWYARIVSACGLEPDIASFPRGDATPIGTKGISLSGGQRQRLALARALYARRPFLVVDDALSGLDARTSSLLFDRVFGPQGICKEYRMTVVLATHSVHYLRLADYIVALGDTGSVVEQGTFAELRSRNGYVKGMDLNDTQDIEAQREEEVTVVEKPLEAKKAADAQQELARRTGDMAVYGYYARSMGYTYCAIVIATGFLFAFTSKFPDIWVQWWSESAVEEHSKHPLGLWIGIAMLLAVCAAGAVFTQIWVMLVIVVPKSSAQLHKQLLHTVMRAPLAFFTNTDSGITLNRFSNDMTVIETSLAGALMQALGGVGLCVASAAIIAAGSRYAAAMMPFLVLVLYMIQRFYLRTSRQLRFMEIEAQAPLITHVSETLAGVNTIRAFNWQTASHQKCLELLDDSQRPYYLLLCIQRWLTLVLDLVTAAIATIVVAMAVMISGSATAGSIGVALLNILSFQSNLAWLITAWTMLETSLGAIARCKNFEASTSSEDQPGEDYEPPQQWPQRGAISFQNITASYKSDGNNVLKGINLSVLAGEKIGICGRSGSGKSSLLLTLLRLLETSHGSIKIDDVDLATVPRQTIRTRLTALPQEAITVPGSLRLNLDPLNLSSDSAMRTALEEVGLLATIEERGGLDLAMGETALSQGQMQLFAVARALLRKSKVLILDEVSASVDAQSEDLMMRLISTKFKDSTVIAVAHRLSTIVNFDRVVVMDQGEIVEIGPPKELLLIEGGRFKEMWSRAGH